jgi:hypothetical protein
MGTPSALVVLGGLGGLQCFRPSDLAPLHLRLYQFEQGRVVAIIELRGVEPPRLFLDDMECEVEHLVVR